jgi:hypothetical protein
LAFPGSLYDWESATRYFPWISVVVACEHFPPVSSGGFSLRFPLGHDLIDHCGGLLVTVSAQPIAG